MNEYERVALSKDRIREAMRAAGKSQADLSRETGLNRSTISRYLSGEVEPRHEATHKMAIVLNVSEMWLFGYDVPQHRTDEQKKNDQLSELIVRMRTDREFFETVASIANLNEKQYQSVQHLISAFNEQF